MQSKYINPFTDFGFKKLFGEEINKDLLMDFLNQLLPEKHQIQELTYQNNENLGTGETDRKAIFDIYCQSQSGEKFIVELQKAKQNFFKDRTVFYSTFPIREQAEKGDWNYELKAVYCIAILDFTFDDSTHLSSETIQTIQLKNQNGTVFYDKLTFIFIEMPRFHKQEHELVSEFDKWLFFIKNLEQFDDIPTTLRNQIFLKAFASAEIAKFDKQQVNAYENSLKYYRDLKNVIDTSFFEGHLEGKLEGKLEGLLEAKLDIAKTLLASGVDVNEVCRITKLSLTDITALTEHYD